ncbi:hypothetical protein AC579_2897 [Pseudocercospora musae]|uniref:AHC1-like C2H2 zinc-finger domain-containing protein n=1 Tax=Pseudocercospora musae TaxID=113226 RepID=A0A139IUG8_9PEZI|nr:hypothetical protein AC579_2897 [Pseudocercospora musae]
MQSIFRLPWGGEQNLKLSDKATLDKMRPMVEIPMLQDLKRKRSASSDAVSPPQTPPVKKQQQNESAPHTSPPVNKHSAQLSTSVNTSLATPAWKPLAPRETPALASEIPSPASRVPPNDAQAPCLPPIMHTKALPDHSVSVAAHGETARMSSLTPLQQVIENEFNMQILMKHNELRLIEQELAKCQIALEQLRRCELRPYPGTSEPSSAVTQGTGPAILPPAGYSTPSHPPPHGVTDGPYSRHYRQWLLHDPLFDSISPEAMAYAEANAGRPTRGHVRKPTNKSIGTARGSDVNLSIPNYPQPAPKDKSAPLVLKRSTDGQLVKLICNNCLRGNFSSIQGFLNHCRIAHKVDYKSHDAAALDCGRLLDENEKANLPPETHAAHAPKPSVSRITTSAVPTPVKLQTRANLTHPMNTPTGLPAVAPRPVPRIPAAPVNRHAPSSFGSGTFNASSQTPRLSNFMSKHGMGGDLEQAVAAARAKIEFHDEDLLSPDLPSDPNSPVTPFAPAGRTIGGSSYFPRPPSRKGCRQPTQRPRPSPLAPAPPHDSHMDSQMSSPQELNSANLSPHTDLPGMVSDHEDDDHSASEEEAPHVEDVAARPPLSTGARTCDAMDIDIEEENVDGIDHGVLIRRNSMLAGEAHGIRSAGSPSRKVGGK